MIEETEEDLLLQDPSIEVNAAKALLEGRKPLKKLYSQKVRAVSHLDFIKECNRIHSTPKGLRVNVKCHALLPHYSNVITRFQNNKSVRKKGLPQPS